MENLIYSAVLQLQACSLGSLTLMTWPDPSSHQQVCEENSQSLHEIKLDYLLSVYIPSLIMHKVMQKIKSYRTVFFLIECPVK